MLQLNKAGSVPFPVTAADATGARGVYREAFSTTAVSRALPSGVAGNFIAVKAYGARFDVSVSVGAATLVSAQSSPMSGAPSAAAGYTLSDGEILQGVVPKDCTHLNFICPGGTAAGELVIFTSEYISKLLSSA